MLTLSEAIERLQSPFALEEYSVLTGEPLLVVEAMKMETTVSAPKGGTISDVFVREGDVVAVGDALVAIA